jgi:hypothetical protein
VIELLYCTHHERLYDTTAYQWIPFLRGDVRLVRAIYPRRGEFHTWEHSCDVCVRVRQRGCEWQLTSQLVCVCLCVASPQPCLHTSCEPAVFLRLAPLP